MRGAPKLGASDQKTGRSMHLMHHSSAIFDDLQRPLATSDAVQYGAHVDAGDDQTGMRDGYHKSVVI